MDPYLHYVCPCMSANNGFCFVCVASQRCFGERCCAFCGCPSSAIHSDHWAGPSFECLEAIRSMMMIRFISFCVFIFNIMLICSRKFRRRPRIPPPAAGIHRGFRRRSPSPRGLPHCCCCCLLGTRAGRRDAGLCWPCRSGD
jgi:hypothetical protein